MSVRYRGRLVDPLALWSDYVDFPPNVNPGQDFAPLVRCPNPEHDTTKRHFQVNLTKPLVHCFAGCGISGTYEDAIAMIEGVTHREARKRILRHSRISSGEGTKSRRRSRSSRSSRSNEAVLDLGYDRYLPQAAYEYLTKRDFTQSTIAQWELGWDSENLRIVIPMKDAKGKLRFLIKRTIRERVEPRYLYPASPVVHKVLFGACFIDLGLVRSQGLILVEGSLDTMMMHQHGFANTVGILGSKPSEIQAQLISNMRPARVITMFDADAAGVGATISTKQKLQRVPIYVTRYPKGKPDPASLSKKEAERAISRVISYRKFQQLTKQSPKRKEKIQVG